VRYYKQDKSGVQLIVDKSPINKDAKTEAEGYTAFKAVTRQRLVNTQQAEKSVRAVVNCRVCELLITL
jgi:hypothetical protein